MEFVQIFFFLNLIKLHLLAIYLHFFSFQLTNLPAWIRIHSPDNTPPSSLKNHLVLVLFFSLPLNNVETKRANSVQHFFYSSKLEPDLQTSSDQNVQARCLRLHTTDQDQFATEILFLSSQVPPCFSPSNINTNAGTQVAGAFLAASDERGFPLHIGGQVDLEKGHRGWFVVLEADVEEGCVKAGTQRENLE